MDKNEEVFVLLARIFLTYSPVFTRRLVISVVRQISTIFEHLLGSTVLQNPG